MYEHYVDCEGCENLNYLMKKEKSEVKITEKEDIIANMTKETVRFKRKTMILLKKSKHPNLRIIKLEMKIES